MLSWKHVIVGVLFLMVTDLQSNFAVAQEYTDPLPVPAQQVIVPVENKVGTLQSSIYAPNREDFLETNEGYFQVATQPDPGSYPTVWMTGLKPEYYDKQVYYTISPLGDFYITVAHIGNQYVRLRKRSVAFRIRIEVRQWQDTDGDGTNDTEVLLNGYNLDKQINYTQRVDTYNY